MTFIASVVAQKGVAVIADSLVTTSHSIISWEDLNELLKKKITPTGRGRKPQMGNVKLKIDEIITLVKSKPSYSKNYEEKLFEYDKYTAVTIAGAAEINEKRIGKIIQEIKDKSKTKASSYLKKNIDQRIDDFIKALRPDLVSHINKSKRLGLTIFIFTHYDAQTNATIIYKLSTKVVSLAEFNKDHSQLLITKEIIPKSHKVVCDGQNRISERILWGELDFMFSIIPNILNKIAMDFPAVQKQLTDAAYLNEMIGYVYKKNNFIFNQDIKMNKLTELSLQQAVDLALLLMKIEVDIQKFTENIQTVGGVIKLAIIDPNGFQFVAGHEVLIPEGIKN